MVTFFAGPFDNISDLPRGLRARPNGNPEPYRGVPGDNTDQYIQKPGAGGALTNGLHRLVLEAGKSGVAAEETDDEKKSPVRAELQPLRQERHQDADQKGTSDVDHQCPQREAAAEPLHDRGSGDVSDQSARATAEENQKMPDHSLSLLNSTTPGITGTIPEPSIPGAASRSSRWRGMKKAFATAVGMTALPITVATRYEY